MGLSLFEFLLSRKPHGVLDLNKESCEEGPNPAKNEIQYILDLRANQYTLGRLSEKMCSRLKNISSACRIERLVSDNFQPEKALVLHTSFSSKLLATCRGSYMVTPYMIKPNKNKVCVKIRATRPVEAHVPESIDYKYNLYFTQYTSAEWFQIFSKQIANQLNLAKNQKS